MMAGGAIYKAEVLQDKYFEAAIRGSNATHLLYPHTGYARFALPVSSILRCAALDFFCEKPERMRLRIRRLAANFGRDILGGLCPNNRLAEIAQFVGCEITDLAIRVGGWDQDKLSILFMDATGGPLVIAKVATSDSSQKLLGNEAAWLEYCDQVGLLSGQRPSKLKLGFVQGDLVLVETIGSGQLLPRREPLTSAHAEFLSALQMSSTAHRRFLGGAMHEGMKDRFHRYHDLMPASWGKRAEFALSILEAGLRGGDTPPSKLSHRDFAPWNMRNLKRSLFVFDWEYACRDCPPLYDLFHYSLAPKVMRDALSPADIRGVIGSCVSLGAQFSDGESMTRRAELQMLAYLLDKSLLHIEAHGGREIGRVADRYGMLIDRYDDWTII